MYYRIMIIKDKIIKADPGKLLWYLPENRPWGKAARLATYKNRELQESDFTEVLESGYEQIEGAWYDLKGMTYAEIKTFIIKLHYSNDDQLAIILNGDEEKMMKMQEWRDYAGEIAKKYRG